VLQSRDATKDGYDAQKAGNYVKANLPFNPTDDFHEYRIDFLPGNVIFYADNKQLAKMKGAAVPDTAGHLVFQHWSNGNIEWSGGPPRQDAITTVGYLKAYFNSSSPQRWSDYQNRCHDPSAEKAVCYIPDKGANTGNATGGNNNFFFSYQNNMTNNQTISDNANDGPGSAQVWWPMLGTTFLAMGWLVGLW